MDMKISGAGVLGGGEYEDVKISGSAKIEGSIRCRSFTCSGAAKGEGDLICREEFRSSGSTHITGDIRAGSVRVNGALKCTSLSGDGEVRLSGGIAVKEKLTGGDIQASGGLKVGGDIEADAFRFACGIRMGPIGGGDRLECAGLLNAETAVITLGLEKHSVNAIGGGTVRVEERPEGAHFSGFGNFSFFGAPWGKSARGCLTVAESIEADQVELTNTVCPSVSGRRVVVGPGCRIDLVRYSESIEVDPAAQVGRQEKI